MRAWWWKCAELIRSRTESKVQPNSTNNDQSQDVGSSNLALIARATVCESKEEMAERATDGRGLAAESGGGGLRFLGYGACALAGTLWGTGFYWGRLALNEMSVEHMVLYRFLFACLGMTPVLLTHRVRLTASELRTLLLAAFFGIPVQFLLQFHGLALTTVSHASLMVGVMPVMLAAAAVSFAGERLDWVGRLALFCSTAGVSME